MHYGLKQLGVWELLFALVVCTHGSLLSAKHEEFCVETDPSVVLWSGVVLWPIVIASVFPHVSPILQKNKKTSSTARIRKEGLLPRVEEWVNRVWRCNHFFLHVFFLLMAHSRCTLQISSNSVVFFNVPFIHLTPSQHRRNLAKFPAPRV
jgi:hypothetical protein